MEQCSLVATPEEQYVTIEIPKELIRHWQHEGYTSLHYGAIRLILSLHGRRGLPVSARVSLLDSSFLHYENAVIGTVLTTLHAGSVVLTMFPNYNVSLRDPTVPQRLKVQVQITGAGQVAEALCATLHHQIIYRLQNHAVNLSLPSSTEGALFVMANPHEESPSIVQIPRNISRQQLEQLIPLQWVTNYEKLHENKKPLQTSEATFRRSVDGTVRTIFKQLGDETSTSSSQIFQSMMIRPVTKEKKIPIWGVLPNGKPIFTDKVNGHFIWDVDPSMCDPNCECSKDDDNSEDEESEEENSDHGDDCRPFPPPRRRSYPFYRPWIGIHEPKEPEILGKEESFSFPTKISKSPIPCFMISGSNYEQEFPSLERTVDPTTRISTKPNICPLEIGPDGRSKPLTQAEEVLNWQTENAKVQNFMLRRIDQKIDGLSSQVKNTNARLELLSERMKEHYVHLTAEISRLEEEWKMTTFGEASHATEREIKKLKAQLHDLDHYIESKIKEKQSPFPDTLSPPPFTPYRPLFQPSSFTGHKSKQPYSLPTATTFRNKQKPRTSIPSVSTQETRKTPTQTLLFPGSQDPYAQFTIENTSIRSSEYTSSDENTENYSDNYSESSDEYANVLIANTASSSTRQEPIYESPEEIEPPLRDNPSKPNSGPWFSIDDLSPNQWRARLIEFGAWLDTKLIKDADSYKVIEEFCCRMTGTLKEWYHNLGPVRQDQFHNLGSTAAVLGALHEEFIGDGAVIDRKMRQEFFEMKCCSLNMKDLDRHFKRMLQRFYLLNGANDVSLKNTYVASLPTQLQPKLNRMAMTAQKDFSTMTMGQIHQMTKEAVNKLCRQHQYFSDLMDNKGKFGKACKKSYLEIKCKDKCSCQNKKNKGEKSYKRKKKNLKFFKKRNFRKRPQGQRCYLCGKKGHFAKSCPNKADKAIKLVTSLKIRDEEVENSSEEEYSEEETLPIFSTEEINSLNPSPHPNIEVQILPTKFNKPVKAIAYIDTGAQKTMMNPDILPEELWSKKTSYFMAADGKIFKTELITKTFIGIKFFPDCIIWAKVIGSKLPGKDILIGMDIFSEADKIPDIALRSKI
ncbi:hypothetical protein V8G54_019381 [Vigna mungo]|uniref:CCHC-type domain-containing protein n=1 Tax=Vigna mungo TaxID=3915 RepID=A0AAQ3NAI7_VIGMU